MTKLGFHAPGATEQGRLAGLSSASHYLLLAGVSPDAAKWGAAARDSWGDSGLAPLLTPTPEDLLHADAWDGALECALTACYHGRAAPLDAYLDD